MELFATDLDRLGFLLETDATFGLHLESLAAQGVELVTEELPPDQRPKYVTNYIGSKQKLVDWIWKHTPDDVESVADAFSGSSAVAYMYKTKGLRVLANDRLRYCYHAARAIVENSDTRFTEADLDKLLAHNSKARTFVRDTFKGIFFAQGVHGLIDNIRANCDLFKGYKKDIALFALGKTCMSGKGGFGHFSSSTQYGKREDSPDEFIERLKGNVARINALVFDGGKPCKASNDDVNTFLAKAQVDLAYFDPPYATEFSTTNYERSYHFVEGLMTYWDGLEINEDSKVKFYETDHETVTKANAKGFFETFLGNATHIPHWLISYRDHAYPNESEMKDLIAAQGRESSMRSHQHHYSITSRHGENSNALERLFICRKAKAMKQAADLRAQGVWDETENEIRYRVRDPKDFVPESFRTKQLKDGVSIIVGKLKGVESDTMVLQAYRFAKKSEENPDGWTLDKAKEWVKKHQTGSALSDGLRAAAMHTSAPIEFVFPSAEALDVAPGSSGDPQFTFVLCRAGTNRNGDHFLAEELA
ncbi:MAG TPA: DNA adenine methylase, partial [Candidatus Hydrogenedentes bacterium]|nr:DNA adenine methylase [Candidatus Hydrogenedentota bacterium]